MISVRRGVANSFLAAASSSLMIVWMRARAQDVEIIGDLGGELVELLLDLVAAQRRQALQAQVEDGLGLLGGELVGAVGRDLVARIVDQLDQRGDVLGRPGAHHQALARFVRVLRGADQLDDFVDVADRDREADQHVGAVARLGEQEFRAPRDDFFPERQEGHQQVLQVHHQRAAAVECHHVDAEGRLQRGETIKLVQHDVRHGVALDLDHDAIAFAVRLVAVLGDAVDLLLADQFADPLQHRGLVHLIRDLADDDRLAILADGDDLDLATHHDRAAAGVIARTDAAAAEDQAAGREIRPGNDVDQVVDREARIVEQREAGVDHLAEIVRRDVGRHADRDAARAVDQQVRELRRQHHRLAFAPVIVRLEIDRVLVEVVEQRHRGLGEAHLGVAFGRGRIAVDRAEIALPVDQRQAHREVLREAHQRVVDRLVAVRMELAHRVAGDARRFVVRPVRRVVVLVHREEDAAVHGLQAVARIRQRTRHDHAHGVIEIRALHLVRDGYEADIRGLRRLPGLAVFGVGQG